MSKASASGLDPEAVHLRGNQFNAKQWSRRFRCHYNHERLKQALDGKTPTADVQN